MTSVSLPPSATEEPSAQHAARLTFYRAILARPHSSPPDVCATPEEYQAFWDRVEDENFALMIAFEAGFRASQSDPLLEDWAITLAAQLSEGGSLESLTRTNLLHLDLVLKARHALGNDDPALSTKIRGLTNGLTTLRTAFPL